MKNQKIKIKRTLYGLKGYEGATAVIKFCDSEFSTEEFDAKKWISDKLATGNYDLSDKSAITMDDVEQFRAALNKPSRQFKNNG